MLSRSGCGRSCSSDSITCVESLQAFRQADRALTREGQIKHSKARHEKDDRRAIGDKRNWVLGFDNREKLAAFQQHAQDLARTIEEFNQKLRVLAEEENRRATRLIQCQTLVNLQWQEIDVHPIIGRIAAIEKQIRQARERNVVLQEIGARIVRQKELVRKASDALINTQATQQNVLRQIEEESTRLHSLQQDVWRTTLTPKQRAGLDACFTKLPSAARLDNLDQLVTSVQKSLHLERDALGTQITECEKAIEKRFVEFKRLWPTDGGDVEANLASAGDFFAKLTRLETDGLPAHEQRFFDLLQNQSHQNLAALSIHLSNARKEIHERMELVNDSLKQVPFNQTGNQTTYLHIAASDRQLPEVREFKSKVQEALSNAWSDDRELAESRFLVLRQLVDSLSSQDPEKKRWRESVLDVRLHVEFIGREMDESGAVLEIYRSGAGKSGGQRQKLATTCLAAALRYQLGGNDSGVPTYAAVILDEAFDKADNDFTILAMQIFANFGFQMIVATPLKSLMTIEPFIGGACFIDIRDRKISSVLLIEYDSERQRLNLPDQAQEEAGVEVS